MTLARPISEVSLKLCGVRVDELYSGGIENEFNTHDRCSFTTRVAMVQMDRARHDPKRFRTSDNGRKAGVAYHETVDARHTVDRLRHLLYAKSNRVAFSVYGNNGFDALLRKALPVTTYRIDRLYPLHTYLPWNWGLPR